VTDAKFDLAAEGAGKDVPLCSDLPGLMSCILLPNPFQVKEQARIVPIFSAAI
jgi:hypothetical protein